MSDWRGKAPGLERANAVMRPMDVREGAAAKYLRVSCYGDHPRMVFALASPARKLQGAIENEHGTAMIGFAPNDIHPRSRIISAARVETAVETATFLDICKDEELSALLRPGGEGWLVYSTGDPTGVAKTLRGAYIAYHKEAAK